MLGLDVIGVSWGDVGDVGKAAFPYVHATGKGIASAFGAGAAADALENVERGQGWLPPATPTTSTVAKTVETTAKKVAPQPKVPQLKQTASTGGKPAALEQPQTQSKFSTGTLVAGVGVFGILVLILHRMWGAR